MYFKSRFFATAAVIIMAAAAVFGSTLKIRGEEEAAPILSWFQDKETMYFWYADETLTNYINSAAVSFGEKRGVRVIPVLTAEDEYLEALNHATLHTEQVPDAYLISNDSLEKAYRAGLAMEIQDTKAVCSEKNFTKAALDAVTYDKRYVAYPMYYETSALIYNQTYLEIWATQQAEKDIVNAGGNSIDKTTGEPIGGGKLDTMLVEARAEEYLENAVPATMDDILYLAETFDVPQGVEGVMKWDVSDIFYNYWIVGNYMLVGGDTGYEKEKTDIDNEETVECLEVYKALNQFFSMETDTISYDSVVQDFIDGKIVFSIVTTDAVAKLAEAKENGSFAYEYGIVEMPDINEELASRSLSVTNGVVVNSYSEHVELANEFAAYLTDEYASTLYERTGKMSANKNVNTDEKNVQVFFEEYTDSVSLPKMMETGNFWLQLEVLFAKVWNGGDVTELVEELAENIEMQISSSAVE